MEHDPLLQHDHSKLIWCPNNCGRGWPNDSQIHDDHCIWCDDDCAECMEKRAAFIASLPAEP